MTDPRPSENTESIPQWPGFRAAGFFDKVPNGDDFFTPADPAGVDHVHEAAHHISWAHEQQAAEGEMDSSVRDNATLAVAEAMLALAEQQRIANKLRVSLIEQVGELARATSNPGYATDPAIGIQGITPDEWEQVGL